MRAFLPWLLGFGLAVAASPSPAGQDLNIAVLAYRPKTETLQQWQPMADHLSSHLPGRQVRLTAMTYPELEQAIADRRVDIVLTQPAHYVLMTRRIGLSSPLATLIQSARGVAVSNFGGVIFARAGRADIATLAALRNRTIATVSTRSLGGYQAQAHVLLRAGLRLPRDARVVETGLPHDLVVQAVLDGRADVGFVRTGVLEAMANEGRLDLADIAVVNRQAPAHMPFLVSTRLYPEWPLAALPHVDEDLARRVAAAVLSLPHDSAIANAIGIHGFTIPADYTPVHELLLELRMPPYEAAPAFTIDDVWQRYRGEIMAATIGGVLILVLASGLWISRRRLLQERSRVAAQTRELHASHELLNKLSSQVPGMIYQYLLRPDGSRSFPYASDTIRDIYAVSPQQARDDAAQVFRRIHPDDLERVQAGIRRSATTLAPWLQEYRIQSLEAGLRWCEDRAMPERLADGGTLWHGFVTDITPRKLIEARLADAAAEKQRLLASLGEGVYGIDHQGICTFINPSALDMLGYAEDEVLGHDQHRLFHHHREDGSDYPARECPITRTLADAQPRYVDEWFIRKDGRGFPVSLLISPIEEDGVCTGAVVAFRDITERLRLEQNLKALATTDPLTELPNRRHLLEQMERELARVRRHPERPATVLMADLDHFKRINDKYGHAAGDLVLRHFAATLREVARKSDLAGRLGGEEFVLLLPDTPIDKARRLAERLRENIETARVETASGRVRYTVSIGITAMTADDAAVDPALARADAALYRAKQRGRNRVEV